MFDSKLGYAHKIMKILTAVAMICAVGAAILYTLAFNAEYDTALHHYSTDCTVIKLAAAAMILCAVCSLVAYIATKDKAAVGNDVSQVENFAVIFTAFMFVAFGIVGIGDHSIEPVNTFSRICMKSLPLLSMISAVPFICAASERLRGSTLHRFTSVFPVLCGTALIFKYYFDIQVAPLNDPEITLSLISIASWMLLMLSEARLALGVAEVRHVGAASIIGLIPGVIGAGRIALYYMNGASPITTVMEDIMLTAVALLAVCRLISLPARLVSAPEPETDKNTESDSEPDTESAE